MAAAIEEATSAPGIVLKGPAISDRLYPDPGLRPYNDLDLMVARESLEGAKTALSAIGYEARIQFRPGFEVAHGHTLDLVRAVGRRSVHVEVHWRLSDDRVGEAISHASLSEGAEPVPGVPGAAYPSLPDQLLVCALHLMSHREKRLAWLEDIRRLNLAATEAEWDAGFRRAQELGLLWVLNRALDYAERYLGLTVRAPDRRRASRPPSARSARWRSSTCRPRPTSAVWRRCPGGSGPLWCATSWFRAATGWTAWWAETARAGFGWWRGTLG